LYYEQLTKITKLTFSVMPHFYLRTSRAWTPCPSGTRKRKAGRSDSIRSIGVGKDLEFSARWLWEACNVLKPFPVRGGHLLGYAAGLDTCPVRALGLVHRSWAPD
jgi:hypothetical protein